MLQFNWNFCDILTNDQANAMVKTFNRIHQIAGAFDTETTGLHIILDHPFLYQFGFIDVENMQGYSYTVDLENQPKLSRAVIEYWHNKLVPQLPVYLGHNIKYDMHMTTNLNWGLSYENLTNLSDTMFYIRYGHDALKPAEGGPPLKLKEYAAAYITPSAKTHERLLAQERSNIAKYYNQLLRNRLQQFKPENKRSYTLAVIKDLFDDPIFDYSDLQEPIRSEYLAWLHEDLPIYLQHKVTALVEEDMIPYNTLNRTDLKKYAHYDIVYTLEIFYKLKEIVENRGNMAGIEMENQLILPFFEMERTGFKTDREYLETARLKLKAYIKERRNVMYTLAGQEFKTGQHTVVLSVLNNDFNVKVTSTNADELDRKLSELIRERGPEDDAVKFISVLQELRTLEKWYSTYILRFQQNLHKTDVLYTTINQVGTVSCRVTSDFQQFPKDAIRTVVGEELFQPRKMVKVFGDDYDGLVYLDYSQIELRFQALYTILVGHPDMNLCRAYMPYQCRDKDGVLFDCRNPEHIKRWQEPWYLDENPEIQWTPTDVHGATTEKATGLTPADPEFKILRSKIGKRVNFAKNYGAQYGKICQMFPDKTSEECHRIDDAYYNAFPGVKHYHDYCYRIAQEKSYVTNAFGIRYYGVSGHKLINILIQGSAACFLKYKIRELYDYMKTNNVKSRLQMQIHDELSWAKHRSELAVFLKFQEIMGNWEDTLVPIVAEMDATITTWAEKKGIHSDEDLRLYFGV